MLSRLLSWLGFEPEIRPTRSSNRRARPNSATAHLFEKRPAATEGKSTPAKAAADDFNPYNTGKFDRSASWERISKNQR
jgi:hypothetical protein